MKTWQDIKPGTYHLRNNLGADLYRIVLSVDPERVTYTRQEAEGISQAMPETFILVWNTYGVSWNGVTT